MIPKKIATFLSTVSQSNDPTNYAILANIGLSELWFGNDPRNTAIESPDLQSLIAFTKSKENSSQ